MIYETTLEFAEVIAGYVDDADCNVERVTVTAGRTNAPVGNCTVIYVWADRIGDELQRADDCRVASRLQLNYEIHTCYIATPGDETDEQHAVAASCLYELMDLVWCGLVADKDARLTDLFGSCKFIELAPLIVQQRQGLNVSALGSVTFPYEC